MLVKEFVEKYENTAAGDQGRLLDSIIIPDEEAYMSFLEKYSLAQRLINATMIDKESGLIELKTPLKKVLCGMSLIYRYTSLEQGPNETGAEIYSDYDMLRKNEIYYAILDNYIPQSERDEFEDIVESMWEDMIKNKFEVHRFFMEMVGTFSTHVSKVLEPLTPLLDQFINMDEKQREKVAEKITKAVEKISK